MSWLGYGYVRNRAEEQEARHQMIMQTAAPEALHPLLGLGGRSIELTLHQRKLPDPGAFALAVEELHAHVVERDAPISELRDAASWLAELPRYEEMDADSRRMLEADWDALQVG